MRFFRLFYLDECVHLYDSHPIDINYLGLFRSITFDVDHSHDR